MRIVDVLSGEDIAHKPSFKAQPSLCCRDRLLARAVLVGLAKSVTDLAGLSLLRRIAKWPRQRSCIDEMIDDGAKGYHAFW
jgi:hypothetical protein